MIKNYIQLLRPRQYVKNLFILLPAFFGLQFFNIATWKDLLFGFFAFSFISSGGYILNDFLDREDDRKHPQKRHRPLASNSVSLRAALFLMGFLWLLGASVMGLLSTLAFSISMTYLFLNILYSAKLKHIAILDVVVIATGFVIRLFVGSALTGIPLSHWIILVTFLLALFLGFAKRRSDLILSLRDGTKTRPVIDGYSLDFLNFSIAITATITTVSYIMYTTSLATQGTKSEFFYVTALFVLIGILRYVQLIFVEDDQKTPTEILWEDNFLQITLLFWVLAFVVLIY